MSESTTIVDLEVCMAVELTVFYLRRSSSEQIFGFDDSMDDGNDGDEDLNIQIAISWERFLKSMIMTNYDER